MGSKRIVRLLVGFLVAWASAACGGSDDGSGSSSSGLACSREDCRGDLSGSWTIQGSCVDEFDIEDEQQDCPAWSCRIVDLAADGTLVFGAGGDADVNFSTTLKSDCTIPKSCLLDDGFDSCEQYQDAANPNERTCTDAGESCKCTETRVQPTEITGTWEIQNGTYLAISGAGSMAAGMDWCVRNGELRMSWLRSANSASPTMHAIVIAR